MTAGQAGDYAEYLDAKTQADGLGDYYLRDGDRLGAPGKWAAGAADVGCDPAQPVDGEVLRQLMAVRRPDSGEPLRRAGSTGEAVAAIDATFSAPKSVSAIWALATPALRARIEQAHEQAIDEALGHSLEHVAMTRVRVGTGTVVHARAERLIATSWRHTSARSVGGQPPDPQLHSHVLLHGAVRSAGSVAAIDSRSWLVHRREIGAAYRTELARGLAQMGFAIRRGTGRAGRYFEVLGVPQALVDRWSSRHHQVRKAIQARLEDRRDALEGVIATRGADAGQARRELAELETAVQLTPKLDRYLTTATRSRKDAVRTHEDLDAHWRRTARQQRFDSSSVERLRTSPRQLTVASDQDLLERLTEFDARFQDRDAYAAAALIRQLVEIEYLAAAFAKEHEVASEWLRADREERLRFWSPARLRERSSHRFLRTDYWHHCETGGHPASPGMALLPDHSNAVPAAFLSADLAGHLLGIWKGLEAALEHILQGSPPAEWELPDLSPRIGEWLRSDDLYALFQDLGAARSSDGLEAPQQDR